jgi:hypothetical protein
MFYNMGGAFNNYSCAPVFPQGLGGGGSFTGGVKVDKTANNRKKNGTYTVVRKIENIQE